MITSVFRESDEAIPKVDFTVLPQNDDQNPKLWAWGASIDGF